MEVVMLAWALLAVLSQWDRGADGANLTLAVVLPRHNTTYPWAWPRVGPAIELAIAKLNAQLDLLPGYKVEMILANSENGQGVCSDITAPLAAVDLKMAYDLHAFVGPGCVYSTAPVARYTRHWGLPLVTAAAEAVGFGQKGDEYALVTRTGASHGKLGDFGVSLSRHFNWTNRAMLLYWDNKTDDRPCFFAVEGLYMQLPSVHNMTIEDVPFMSTNYTDLIREIKQKARSKFSAEFGGHSSVLDLWEDGGGGGGGGAGVGSTYLYYWFSSCTRFAGDWRARCLRSRGRRAHTEHVRIYYSISEKKLETSTLRMRRAEKSKYGHAGGPNSRPRRTGFGDVAPSPLPDRANREQPTTEEEEEQYGPPSLLF